MRSDVMIPGHLDRRTAMGGLFGVVGKDDIVEDLYYGTDYHSHLGTKRGGLAAGNGASIVRYIHNIENAQFRSKFGDDVGKLHGSRASGSSATTRTSRSSSGPTSGTMR